MLYIVQDIGEGWYCFKNIPQDHRYIKVDCLMCLTDRKALNQAKKIGGKEHTYKIERV